MDLVLCSLPPASMSAPPLGPALLMSWVRSAGFEAKFFDLNAHLFYALGSNPNYVEWLENDYIFHSEATYKKFEEEYFSGFIDSWIDKIEELNPRWLGLSMISFRSRLFFESFAKKMRARLPHIKIVIGGGFVDEVAEFRQEMASSNLCDAFVKGEGELALIEVLRGNLESPGINGRQQEMELDLDQQKLPDYSDIDIKTYSNAYATLQKKISYLYIESSRGCIRKCRFCNVPQSESVYRYRHPKKVLEEIIRFEKEFSTELFLFTDSLVNGSLKFLYEFCDLSIEHYHNKGRLPPKLQGYFIIRPEKNFPKHQFKRLKLAGFSRLAIGVESGSAKVRHHMRKLFSNEDLLYTVRNLHENNISSNLLFMTGYPTETEDDFQETLNVMQLLKPFKDSIKLKCSWRVSIKKLDSQLNSEAERMGIVFDEHGEWSNENVNAGISVERYSRFRDLAKNLGYSFMQKTSDKTIADILDHSLSSGIQ